MQFNSYMRIKHCQRISDRHPKIKASSPDNLRDLDLPEPEPGDAHGLVHRLLQLDLTQLVRQRVDLRLNLVDALLLRRCIEERRRKVKWSKVGSKDAS